MKLKYRRVFIAATAAERSKSMKTRPAGARLLTALLTLCMVLSLAPISAYAADSTVSNEAELEAALENADCTEIKLGGNIETTYELNVNRTVTLDLNGYTLSCSSTDEDIIRVRSSGNLTVKDSEPAARSTGRTRIADLMSWAAR